MIPLLLTLVHALTPAHAADCFYVSGVVAHTPDGPVADATVAWDGTRLLHVGPGAAPQGCQARAVPEGAHVTPGFVAMPTTIGVREISLEDGTHSNHWPGDQVAASVRVADGYNPYSSLVPITRLGGVTHSLVQPDGGLVAGQPAAVRLAGDTQAEVVVAGHRALWIAPGKLGSRPAGLAALRELFSGADLSGTTLGEHITSADRSVLSRARKERWTLYVPANRASDIEALLRFVDDVPMPLVIVGGAEAWMHAEGLARRGVAVVVDPLVYGPGGMDAIHGRKDNAAVLAEAGVDVILSSFESHNARALRFVAGNAVRGGMSHADAIKAITHTPGKVLGLKGQGSLSAGGSPTLAIWTDDPLDVTGRLHALWIDGRPIALESRQSRLVDAWRVLDGPVAPITTTHPR